MRQESFPFASYLVTFVYWYTLIETLKLLWGYIMEIDVIISNFLHIYGLRKQFLVI